jgi:hypothetical protein
MPKDWLTLPWAATYIRVCPFVNTSTQSKGVRCDMNHGNGQPGTINNKPTTTPEAAMSV